MQTVNASYENVAKFKHLVTDIKNKNCIPEEIKSRPASDMMANIRFKICYFLFYYLEM